MTRLAIPILAFCLAAFPQVAQCRGGSPAPNGGGASDCPRIAADLGARPPSPARSNDSGPSAHSASTWTAPGPLLEWPPPAADAASLASDVDLTRPGYPPGVERPPTSSF